MPRTCEVIEVAMARPAASSLAELMRLPVDRRSIAVPSALLADDDALAAFIALMFVLITLISKVSLTKNRCLGVDRFAAAGTKTGRETRKLRAAIGKIYLMGIFTGEENTPTKSNHILCVHRQKRASTKGA